MIGFELWRNLGLAGVCVFVITLILLADFRICLMVLSCVALTLVRAHLHMAKNLVTNIRRIFVDKEFIN